MGGDIYVFGITVHMVKDFGIRQAGQAGPGEAVKSFS